MFKPPYQSVYKKHYVVVLLVLIIANIIFILLQSRTVKYNLSEKVVIANPKCGEDFPDTDQGYADSVTAMDKWTNDFYDLRPDATISDWSKARHQFWVDNSCLVSLKRYDDAVAGKADPATMKIIKDAIHEEINKQSQ